MTDPRDLPPFLTVAQTAELLNVAGSTVTAAIETGALPAVRLGGDHRATRIRRDDLFPSENATRDLTVKRLRRLQLAAREARERENVKLREYLDARDARETAERAVDAELLLTDLDARATALRSAS
jgi:excisionase family DNA binding protein